MLVYTFYIKISMNKITQHITTTIYDHRLHANCYSLVYPNCCRNYSIMSKVLCPKNVLCKSLCLCIQLKVIESFLQGC